MMNLVRKAAHFSLKKQNTSKKILLYLPISHLVRENIFKPVFNLIVTMFKRSNKNIVSVKIRTDHSVTYFFLL